MARQLEEVEIEGIKKGLKVCENVSRDESTCVEETPMFRLPAGDGPSDAAEIQNGALVVSSTLTFTGFFNSQPRTTCGLLWVSER